MKPIILTEEQESNLLEICDKLFPDTKWHFWESDREDYPRTIGYNNHATIGKHTSIQPALEIPWFEFTINTLLREIAIQRTNIKDFGFDPEGFDRKHKKYLKKVLMYDNPKHPIDYLYSEFKKIKEFQL